MKPPTSCDKQSMKRGLWSEDEDAKILEYVSKHGTGKWNSIPKKAGLRRCGKSCRLRWTNYLRPDLKHENFTPKEEELIIKLHAAIGSRWSMIAQQLPGRTDNDVKNCWNTKLKKKLVDMGIDPVTHKPFSQIFADYGNLGGPSRPGMRIGSFNKDLKNATFIKTDTCSNSINLPSNTTNNNSPFSMPIITTMPLPSPTLIVPPKTEPIIQDNNHSLDLLAELQAINLVKEASNYNPIITTTTSHESSSHPNNFLIDKGVTFSPSTSSSSSSTCSSAAKDFSPIGFNWNEFLLEDEFLPNEDQDCQEKESQRNHNDNKDVAYNTITSNGVNENNQIPRESESSFVEALIAKESEMLMEFRDLMGQEFY